MYVHPKFAITQPEAIAFARQRGFGLACANSAGTPIAVHVPFVVRQLSAGRFEIDFHVSRANPIAECADGNLDWLIAVQGADAYVSADYYDSAEQVPTWLYEAVHLTGPVRVMAPAAKEAHMVELSAEFEARLLPKPPWTVDKMSENRLAAMRQGIVGLTMHVLAIQGQRKWNQHKSDADHIAVADALVRSGDAAARAIASRMRKLRPELPYGAGGREPERDDT